MFIVVDVGELLGAEVGPSEMVGAFDIEGWIEGAFEVEGCNDGISVLSAHDNSACQPGRVQYPFEMNWNVRQVPVDAKCCPGAIANPVYNPIRGEAVEFPSYT